MKTPFIIAEIGSNWKTLDDISISIQSAKNAGADAVKFQLYNEFAMYGKWTIVMQKAGGDFVRADMIGELQTEWLPKMKAQCDRLGVEFMCSAFSPELYDIVNPFVNIHKVASAELSHIRILEKLRGYGKPVILSTGASGVNDVEAALKALKGLDVTLLYCVASYPANDINLANIKEMQKVFGCKVGYSDHSLDTCVIPRQAVLEGACVIEKHVTAFPDMDTPDRPHSLTMPQFKKMVDVIRNEQIPSLGWTQEEQDMISKHNRRLIVIKDMKAGEDFKEGVNFGIYRALTPQLTALSPFAINSVIGKKAMRDMKAGDGIGPQDLFA